jgi:hypothetical protein
MAMSPTAFLSAQNQRIPYLLDLTLWYEWHQREGTLPEAQEDASLSTFGEQLGSPAWLPIRPWRQETPGITRQVTETVTERTVELETGAGTLVSRWERGPDGDWWQTAYPVTEAEQLPALAEVVQARTYYLDPTPWKRAQSQEPGIVPALALPRRPYSDLLHDYLGWSQGLFLLYEQPERITELVQILERKLQALVDEITALPGDIVYSPDNLDGQFISPRAFDQYLGPSYAATTDRLSQANKALWIHVGGPVSKLLPKLGQAGIAAIEGICGPPQGDTALDKARDLVGPSTTLWGGIPQDALLETYEQAAFEEAVRDAVTQVRDDGNAILGVADRVPVQALWERLCQLPELFQKYARKG